MSQSIIGARSTERRQNVFKGDGVRVHLKVKEGQNKYGIFPGIVIARKGSGIGETLRFVELPQV